MIYVLLRVCVSECERERRKVCVSVKGREKECVTECEREGRKKSVWECVSVRGI